MRNEEESSHVVVSTAFFCVNKSSSWAVFALWLERVFVAALHAVTGSPVNRGDSTFLVTPGRREEEEAQSASEGKNKAKKC